MNDKKNYNAIKTDTAGILFSCYHFKDYSRIIRMSVVLANEEVNPKILEEAVRITSSRFPMFCRRYKRGIFTGMLEYTAQIPEVTEEKEIPAFPQWLGKNGNPEYRFTYYKRRITLEMSHVMTDGTGLYEFLTATTAQYLVLCGMDKEKCNNLRLADSEFHPDEGENAYARYFTNQKSDTTEPKPKATYNIPGKIEVDCLIHTQGLIKTEQLKALSAKYNMTVTQYLAAVMVYAVIQAEKAPITEKIRVEIPVNLRKYFPTETVRNFSASFPLVFDPKGRTDVTLDEVCKTVSGQLAKFLNKKTLQLFINSSHGLASSPVVRILPYFVQSVGLRLLQKSNLKKGSTVKLSNLGYKVLPEEMQNRTERIEFLGGSSYFYGQAKFCTVIGYKNYLSFCFASCTKDMSVEKAYFSTLSSLGVNVRVETTNPLCFSQNETGKTLMYCPDCNTYAPENGTHCALCGNKLINTDIVDNSFSLSPYSKTQLVPAHKKTELHKPSIQKIKTFFTV